jgi:hypothetical protein
MRVVRAVFVVAACCLAVPALSGASHKFTSTWKPVDATPLSFSGKKVAALVITTDDNLRMSAEEALKREITARGPIGVATYTLVPREELRDKDRARGWFERSGVEGVVTLRVVSVDKELSYGAVVWSSGYYGNYWNFYDASWNSVYAIGTPIGKPRQDTRLAVETLIYRVPDAKLLWAGVSETTNPKDVGSFMKGFASAVGEQLKKAGLVKK